MEKTLQKSFLSGFFPTKKDGRFWVVFFIYLFQNLSLF